MRQPTLVRLGFKTQIQLKNSITQLLAKHAGVARQIKTCLVL